MSWNNIKRMKPSCTFFSFCLVVTCMHCNCDTMIVVILFTTSSIHYIFTLQVYFFVESSYDPRWKGKMVYNVLGRKRDCLLVCVRVFILRPRSHLSLLYYLFLCKPQYVWVYCVCEIRQLLQRRRRLLLSSLPWYDWLYAYSPWISSVAMCMWSLSCSKLNILSISLGPCANTKNLIFSFTSKNIKS